MATVNELKKQLLEQMSHPFLEKYVGKPRLDIDKLWLLAQITKQIDSDKRKTYIFTTMLVQIALDTHDFVQSESTNFEFGQADRKTQLTVLAGDYYSGLYYYLLSIDDEIDFIRLLAVAIKEINEQKMTVYGTIHESTEKFLNSYKKIDFHLLLKVADYLDCTSEFELVCDLLYYKKMIAERDALEIKAEETIFGIWLKEQGTISLQSYRAELNQYILLQEKNLFDHETTLQKRVKKLLVALTERRNITLC